MNALEKKIAETLKKRKLKKEADKKSSSSSKSKSKSSKSKSKPDSDEVKPVELDADGNPVKPKKKKRKFKNAAEKNRYYVNKATSKRLKHHLKNKYGKDKNKAKDEKPKTEEIDPVTGEPVAVDHIPSGFTTADLQMYTPEQQKAFKEAFANIGPESINARLAKGDQSYFEQMEAPALKQFNDIQAGIANKYSMGGGGPGARSSRQSSGFQNAQTAAASDFAARLQAERLGYTRQATKDLYEHTSDLLNKRPVDRTLIERPKKPQKNMNIIDDNEKSGIPAIGGAVIGGGLGFVTGGPAGILPGAKTGYDLGSSLG